MMAAAVSSRRSERAGSAAAAGEATNGCCCCHCKKNPTTLITFNSSCGWPQLPILCCTKGKPPFTWFEKGRNGHTLLLSGRRNASIMLQQTKTNLVLLQAHLVDRNWRKCCSTTYSLFILCTFADALVHILILGTDVEKMLHWGHLHLLNHNLRRHI